MKELVELKVRVSIDGWSFNTEGYERVKNILITEYGKEFKIVNVYISNIMGFLVIISCYSKRIDEFY